MDITVKSSNPARQPSQCLVLGVYGGKKPVLSATGAEIDKASGKRISTVLSRGDLGISAGSNLVIHDLPGIRATRVMLVSLGKSRTVSDNAFRSAVTSMARYLVDHTIRSADITLLEAFGDTNKLVRQSRNLVESAVEATYRYQETLSGKKKPVSLKRLSLVVARKHAASVRHGAQQGLAIANGVAYTKNLSNLPGNICTPGYLARQARALQKSHPIRTTVLDEAQMKRLKMGSLLSVSRGSREPAKLIVMEYRGARKIEQPVVLVGKGLTFDAGGISIKPAAAMDEMKYDMCGGASVFGAMIAAAEMELPINLVGIVPSSENLPDGAANKPGDIVTAMDGTTIEILNTDAEGRLILCDALTYSRRFKPAVVIDIATLTGACIIALGHHASGMYSNREKLARELLSAGKASGDRVWQMPLWEDYSKQLKSNFADLANIGGKGAGSVTAACFLKHFVDGLEWAHLDIAGTAWKSGGQKGATGRPVPLLAEFLIGRSENKK